MPSLHELRYVYRVEGAGASFETVSLQRAFYHLGQLSQQTDTATLTVEIHNKTTNQIQATSTLAHAIDGSLEEYAYTPFTPIAS